MAKVYQQFADSGHNWAARPARATDDDADLNGKAAGETGKAAGETGKAARDRSVTAADPDRTADSAPAEDSAQPTGSGSAAAGEDGGNGDGDQDRPGWRIGSGTMSDPATEPAK